MDTNERQLLKLIREDEGISTEFKTCRSQLNRDVYETVCTFLNRHGSTLFHGLPRKPPRKSPRKSPRKWESWS